MRGRGRDRRKRERKRGERESISGSLSSSGERCDVHCSLSGNGFSTPGLIFLSDRIEKYFSL